MDTKSFLKKKVKKNNALNFIINNVTVRKRKSNIFKIKCVSPLTNILEDAH